MNLSKRQQVIAETRLAAALGRPERRCPACHDVGAHWTPDGLDDFGLVIPGHFTCQPTPLTQDDVATLAAFDPDTDQPMETER